MSSERATLYLYDESKNTLWAQSGHGLNDQTEGAEGGAKQHTIVLRGNEGVAGAALAENKTMNINEIRRDSTVWSPKVDDQTGFRTRNILAIPILDQATNKKLGVLQVMNKKVGPFDFLTDSHFTEFDEKGFPTKNKDGEPIAKAQLKKLQKQMKVHEKAHEQLTKKAGGDVDGFIAGLREALEQLSI